MTKPFNCFPFISAPRINKFCEQLCKLNMQAKELYYFVRGIVIFTLRSWNPLKLFLVRLGCGAPALTGNANLGALLRFSFNL